LHALWCTKLSLAMWSSANLPHLGGVFQAISVGRFRLEYVPTPIMESMSARVELMTPTSLSPEWLLEYLGARKEFIHRVEEEARAAPVIGDTLSATPITLAHYSRSADVITHFNSIGQFSWTNRISDNPETIGGLTGLYGEVFTSLYIARLAVTRGLHHRGSGQMEEYRIDRSLAAGEFVRIPLKRVADGRLWHYAAA